MEDDSLLEEVLLKNNVEPQVFAYKCDDKMEGIPSPLPNSIFRMACIGKSGSGKSNLVQALTQSVGKKRIYNKKFSNVFIVSPSVASQGNKPKLPADRFYTSVKDLPTIFDRLQNEDGMEGRTLIILDDIGSEIKKCGEETIILKKLFNNGRHIGRPLLDEETGEQIESGAVSILITLQKLSQAPPYLRAQFTHLAIFDCRNTKSELQVLYEEFFSMEKNIFNEILYRTYSVPYNFIFVDTQKSIIYNGFKSKFNVNNKVYL
tara:strand:+ start:3154 stop:3939 length:786 start_codon:yes stop_codon:yes gene_type:complete